MTRFFALPPMQRSALTRLDREGVITTSLASDHMVHLYLVRRGWVSASEPIEAIRQAAGLVPGTRIPSGTFPVTYTLLPEGRVILGS